MWDGPANQASNDDNREGEAGVTSCRDCFIHPTALVESNEVGAGSRFWAFVHVLDGAVIGRDCNIGDHCFIENHTRIGDEVVIKNGVSVWEGVTIEDRAFIGPNAVFTNDRVPRAKVFRDAYDRTVIRRGASIGANSTLVAPITVGQYALVGSGSIVTHDVPDYGLVYGSPARLAGYVCRCGKRLPFRLEQDGTVGCDCGQSYTKAGAIVQEAQVTSNTPAPSVRFVDLAAQHAEVREELDAALREIFERSAFIGGPNVEGFEREFAAYCGVRHAIGCGSGTDALKLALMAVGVAPGDEVITVPMTFIATAEGASLVGAHPVFVDVDPETCTMDPARLREFLERCCRVDRDGRTINTRTGRRVAAVVPVHLYGCPADMPPILETARQYGLEVIEDACQAHGATCRSAGNGSEKRAGSIAKAGCFSFYPGKNLGAVGEAGAITTDDDQIAERVRVLRDHGQSERYMHVSPDGWNGRLDALQAAVLRIKLKRLDRWNEQRCQVASWYRQGLSGLDLTLPRESACGRHVYHLYVIRVKDRDRVRAELAKRNVPTGLHYPIALHLQPAYSQMGLAAGDYPASEAIAETGLSLPMHPHLSKDQVEYICHCLREILACS